MMVRIAFVEDNDGDALIIRDHLARYERENDVKFEITRFENGLKFLSQYKHDYDMVFMDIEIIGPDGMEISRRLRKLDRKIVIIFMTNMAQFAVKGYEVDALDFVVKPVGYYDFCMKMKKALDIINKNNSGKYIFVNDGDIFNLNIVLPSAHDCETETTEKAA